jgi:hypothetical protein
LLSALPPSFTLQDDDDDDEGVDEQRPWHKRPKVWLHVVAFGLSACLLLVGIGSQVVPWMKVVSGALQRGCAMHNSTAWQHCAVRALPAQDVVRSMLV